MAKGRPTGTKLIIEESYVDGLEEKIVQKDKMVEEWRNCMGPLVHFLEMLREKIGEKDFDKLINHFNESDANLEIIISPDDSIRFKLPDEKEKSDN